MKDKLLCKIGHTTVHNRTHFEAHFKQKLYVQQFNAAFSLAKFYQNLRIQHVAI